MLKVHKGLIQEPKVPQVIQELKELKVVEVQQDRQVHKELKGQ